MYRLLFITQALILRENSILGHLATEDLDQKITRELNLNRHCRLNIASVISLPNAQQLVYLIISS